MGLLRFAAGIAATSTHAAHGEACRAAERGGFDAYARPDHLLAEGVLGAPGAPLLECFTATAALVPTTRRLRFLRTVTCNSFRHPGLLAKMIATLDVISDGRMELGIGAGWLRTEYEAYGYDFPPAAIRLAQLREALDVVRLLWSGGSVDYDGTYYRLRGAVSLPRPVQHPRPPILVGGGGAGLLAVAAAAADIVNIVPPTSAGVADRSAVGRFTLAAFARKAARLRALAEAAGRDPGELTLAGMFFVQLAETREESRRLLAELAAHYGFTPGEAERFPLALIGTPAELRERLAERIGLLDLGYVVLQFPTGDALTRFAAEVLPAVRG